MQNSAQPTCNRWVVGRCEPADGAASRRDRKPSQPDRRSFSPKLALKRSFVAAPTD